MAYEAPGFSFPFPSAVDYTTGKQFRFVALTATGKVGNPTAAGNAVGVRQNTPRANEATTVVISGISIVEAGAEVTAGSAVGTDATGAAVPATGTVLGVALEDAPAAGVQIAVLLSTPTASV